MSWHGNPWCQGTAKGEKIFEGVFEDRIGYAYTGKTAS
jgi:hypothetical protein